MTAPDWQTALDHVPLGVAIYDSGLSLTHANGPLADLLSVPDALVVPGAGLGALVRFLAERGDLGAGAPELLAAARMEAILTAPRTRSERRNARGHFLEITTSRLPDGGVVLSYADISGRVAAEDELARINATLEGRVAARTAELTSVNAELELARLKAVAASKDKTRFLAAASHDLLQPLNAARLYTSTLIERSRGTDFGDLAGRIDTALTSVEDIMATLLDLSRIDSGALKANPSTASLREIVGKIAVEFQPAAAAKSIRLKVVPVSLSVTTDRVLLARVLQNLVSNAIKYTPPGGRVLVGCRRRGNKVRIDVIDTGIGIRPEQQSLIFTEFTRLDQGARVAPGMGLGLSIVQRIVEVLGTPLDLRSEPGKGTRFSVLVPRALPVAAEPALPERRAAERTGAGTGADLSALKVLCVDNEAPILEGMAGLLSGWGVDVRTALSLKTISNERMLEGWFPDVVLMDYHLDQTSGLDAIEWLRQMVGAQLQAALVTADRSDGVRALAESRNVMVVNKPVRPAALRAALTAMARAGQSADSPAN